METIMVEGRFPRAYLVDSEMESILWRRNFIATFLEKDLAIFEKNIPSTVMYRLWTMASHYHGQTLNYAQLARSLDLRPKKIKNYLSILEDTFMIRLLMPWYANVSKRLVKSPKLYIRDTGLFHALQGIESAEQLYTHPNLGASWEGFALEEIIAFLGKRDNEVFFYGAHSGVELDLFFHHKGEKIGIEFKFKDAPTTTKSMHQAIEDLQLDKLFVIYPGERSYALTATIQVIALSAIENYLR